MSHPSYEAPPICPTCHEPMAGIGRLPRMQHKREVLVFRCGRCSFVVTNDPDKTTTGREPGK